MNGGQGVHVPDPGSGLYEYMHERQKEPSGPYEPGLHLQAVSKTLPGGEDDLYAHIEHFPGPGSGLNVLGMHAAQPPLAVAVKPATHSSVIMLHGPPSGPEKPALHLQSVSEMLPAGDMESRGQDKHADAPVSALYVSDGHREHSLPVCV